MKAIFFGQSHTNAYRLAWLNLDERPNLSFEPSFAMINGSLKWLKSAGDFKDGVFSANPAIMTLLHKHRAFTNDPGTVVVSTFGGQEHTTLGLLSDGSNFDFVMEDEITESPVIPAVAVRRTLEDRSAINLALIEEVNEETPHRMICMETPPPPASNEWVNDNLDTLFKRRIKNYGWTISKPEFRRKLWKMRSLIFKEACERIGVDFISIPDRLLENGFLKEEYLGNATHANPKFGAEMLLEIDAVLAREVA